MIALSEWHRIELAEELSDLVENPRRKDYTIHTIADKSTAHQQLVQMALVIAGAETREAFPLARKYPVHFLKQYYPASFHPDPAEEFHNLEAISTLLESPPPIGWTRNSIRSCFIPGTPFDRLSPFGVEPPEANIRLAEEARSDRLIGLWYLLESLHRQVKKLHRAGWCHGDLELHNTVVSLSPIRLFLIDFEAARKREGMDAQEWKKACREDLRNIFREAIYIQSAIGRQPGPLGRESVRAMDWLFKNPEPFRASLSAVGLHEP